MDPFVLAVSRYNR
jgi:tetratricopeptide repeat protein 8